MIKNVTVVGANGRMGIRISALFASFGKARVFMISRDVQKSRAAVDEAVKSVRADDIRNRLVPCDYSQLKDCVSNSDLIFESLAENICIKKDIITQIGNYVDGEAIIATGTSSISINQISKALPEGLRKRFYGMHFFNPPYSMTLLELIPTDQESKELTSNMKDYLQNVLLRKVVVVDDKPAFLANRIGFQFINLALQYAEKKQDKGGIDYIDAILGSFTGRSIPPCATADYVGLDIYKAILDNVYNNTNDFKHDCFRTPAYIERLINEGRIGKKSGCGLYKTATDKYGAKHHYSYDIQTNSYCEKKRITFPFSIYMKEAIANGDYQAAFSYLLSDNSEEASICRFFLRNYIDYSKYVAKEVCNDPYCADVAMATGFNWCPPLAMANAIFGEKNVTEYDYRCYFKAG